MQAIETKYICPTNFKGARIKAFCVAMSKTFSYDSLQDECIQRGIPLREDTIHALAAEKLRRELDWNETYYGRMVQGQLKNSNYVFVFTGKE